VILSETYPIPANLTGRNVFQRVQAVLETFHSALMYDFNNDVISRRYLASSEVMYFCDHLQRNRSRPYHNVLSLYSPEGLDKNIKDRRISYTPVDVVALLPLEITCSTLLLCRDCYSQHLVLVAWPPKSEFFFVVCLFLPFRFPYSLTVLLCFLPSIIVYSFSPIYIYFSACLFFL
jgi:hypothetical protein